MGLLAKILVKAVAPIPKLDSMQKYLFIGPHPDDIEVGAGGTVAKLCRMGKEVHFLVITDGAYGTDKTEYDKDELIALRQAETRKSADILGVKSVTFLPYRDGGDYDENAVKYDIMKKILEIKPDAVFCPDPHLKTECHTDHLKTGRASSAAYMFSSISGLAYEKFGLEKHEPKVLAYYYTSEPNTFHKMKREDLKKQGEAMRSYASQFKVVDGFDQLKYLIIYQQFRAVRSGLTHFKGYAEEFRCLTGMRMHCFMEKVK